MASQTTSPPPTCSSNASNNAGNEDTPRATSNADEVTPRAISNANLATKHSESVTPPARKPYEPAKPTLAELQAGTFKILREVLVETKLNRLRLALQNGRHQEAREVGYQAIEAAKQEGSPVFIGRSHYWLGMVKMHLFDWEGAHADFEQTQRYFSEVVKGADDEKSCLQKAMDMCMRQILRGQ